MAGLDPAILVFLRFVKEDVDARIKSAHDDGKSRFRTGESRVRVADARLMNLRLRHFRAGFQKIEITPLVGLSDVL